MGPGRELRLGCKMGCQPYWPPDAALSALPSFVPQGRDRAGDRAQEAQWRGQGLMAERGPMAVLCADLAEAVGNTLVGGWGGSQPGRRNGLGPPGRWVWALHALSQLPYP